jgi:hypothetical protein
VILAVLIWYLLAILVLDTLAFSGGDRTAVKGVFDLKSKMFLSTTGVARLFCTRANFQISTDKYHFRPQKYLFAFYSYVEEKYVNLR